MWKIKEGFWAEGALSVYESAGVPVLVTRVGTYPEAVSEDGRSTTEVPHIRISVYDRSVNGKPYYSGVTVYAEGNWHHGRRRSLEVFTAEYEADARIDDVPDEWIKLGESKLAEAIDVLGEVDVRYDEASAIISRSDKYADPMSREDYEAACAECLAEMLSDAECLSYGVKYGVFTFPEYSAEHVVKMDLANRRMASLIKEQEAAAKTTPVEQQRQVAMQGQLWEPCEICGEEPVYMPLHRCQRCWPK